MNYPFEGKVIEGKPFQGRSFYLQVENIEQPILLWPMSSYRECFSKFLGKNVVIEGNQEPEEKAPNWENSIEVRTMKEVA